MMTCKSFNSLMIITAVILTLTTGCATAFRSEPEHIISSNGEFGLNAKRYNDMGYDKAKDDYSSVAPFFIGTFTGLTLPAATTGAASLVNKASRDTEFFGMVAGISTAYLLTQGGYTLAKKLPTPKPDQYTTGLSQKDRQEFDRGYESLIWDRRGTGYTYGMIFGIGINLYLLLKALSGLGPIGV